MQRGKQRNAAAAMLETGKFPFPGCKQQPLAQRAWQSCIENYLIVFA